MPPNQPRLEAGLTILSGCRLGSPRRVEDLIALSRNVRRNPCSRSPDPAFNFTGMRMEDRADREVVLEVLEGLLDLGELHVVLPERRGVFVGQVRAQQVAALPPAALPEPRVPTGVEN